MAVSRERRVPAWAQIADAVRAQISAGELAPEDRLPTEAELMARHDVARSTVRQALTALVNEGLIVPRAPRGYFVRNRKPLFYRPQQEFRAQPAYPEMDRFMADHSAEGREPKQEIEVAIVDPPADVRKRLNLAEGELAAVRRRIRYLDGEPYNTNDSYFPLAVVQGSEIMNPADIARGANEVLRELGYPQTRTLDEIYIRMPDPNEIKRLELGPGTPVACHICTGLCDDGTPIRVVVNILPGDRHVIVYERDGMELRK
ncbi:GntR family transcriptional regulator [Catenuloplanes nepalensis]|uniref:GntR family transcriptional regulator n=1 Tax=Catenuloplanes nepalensis TaxID=587533 RepID=A0ABT9N414_9ACTN|nr:GntR family transcriptional regulator [Catenuloplanes nepalensis]MDP9798300.1 GntR family transcriptional regulator [Catenuloplanes nepalensis]